MLEVYAGKAADRVGMRGPMVLGSAGLAAGLLIPWAFQGAPALCLRFALLFGGLVLLRGRGRNGR